MPCATAALLAAGTASVADPRPFATVGARRTAGVTFPIEVVSSRAVASWPLARPMSVPLPPALSISSLASLVSPLHGSSSNALRRPRGPSQ